MFFWKNRHFFNAIMIIVLASTLIGSNYTTAYAGSFTHTHTKNCYKKVTKTCTNHELSYGKETLYRDCPTCKENRECSYGTYTDICRSNLVDPLYVGEIITCRSCGTVLVDNKPSGLRSHQYTVTELACGKQAGQVIATTSAGVSSSEWTNKSVTVYCNVDVKDSSFSLAGISFNGGEYKSNTSYEVTNNGSYSFAIRSSSGDEVTESVTVSNIDKVAPAVSLSKSTDAWTEKGLTITASASDDLSGLADAPYSFGGAFSSDNSLFVSSNGTYSVTVVDKAGNSSSASITVSNIGRDPEEIRKEEEEKKRKEEEERKKREEEERRKREEEERKKKEDGKEDKKNKDDEEKKDNPGDDGNKKGESGNKDERKPGIGKIIEETISSLFDKDVSENDISQNDISENDISGNIISPRKTDKKNIENNESSESASSGGFMKWLMSLLNDSFMYVIGAFLVTMAFFVLSTVNFIYTDENGEFRAVAFAKVSKDSKRLFVNFPAKDLEKEKCYKIFYSVWSRKNMRRRKVIIDVDNPSGVILANDQKSFVYNG